MSNPNEQYDSLHDHCQAIARERDWLQLEVQRLSRELALVNETLLGTLTFEQAIKVMDGLKK